MRDTYFFESHGTNWDTKKVKDVAVVNEENISSSDFYDEIEYIEISNVNKGEISDIPIINFDDAPSRAKRKVKQNDILISTVRPNLEHYAYIKSAKSNTIASTGFAVITTKEIEPRFLYYVLTSQKYTDYFSMIAEGHTSAYPAMNPDVIENVQISVPPKYEQKRIAHILGTLDDKIELNQRMNETLEAIARAIFKSWFVDFDPVRAKMAGEPYPLPDAIMALFPDELVESELGMIPKGWAVGKLGDEFKVVMGQSPPGSSYNEEGKGIAFYQGRTDFGFRYPSERVYCTEPKRFAEPGDTLVSVRAPVGDVNMAKEKCCIGRGVAAIRHKSDSSSYTYYSMLDLQRRFKVFEAEGTVFGSIGKKDFITLHTVLRSNELIQTFEIIAGTLDKKIENNSKQIETLTETRDTLLPIILNGDIEI